MRFLIDETFGSAAVEHLRTHGHDASGGRELGLAGHTDSEVLARAVDEQRVLVTENAADFIALLDRRAAAGQPLTPVVVALKRRLPRGAGALESGLAHRLSAWCEAQPDPYRHIHWLA